MGGEVLQVRRQGLALFGGFAGANTERQGDIAQVIAGAGAGSGERQHVGRRVLAAEGAVKGLQPRVGGQQDGDVGVGASLGFSVATAAALTRARACGSAARQAFSLMTMSIIRGGDGPRRRRRP